MREAAQRHLILPADLWLYHYCLNLQIMTEWVIWVGVIREAQVAREISTNLQCQHWQTLVHLIPLLLIQIRCKRNILH